jgi:hypothetical protein
MEKERAIVKFNGGLGALLCSSCRKILRTAKDFSKEELMYIRGELQYLPPQFCSECVIKDTKTKENV